LCKILIGLYLCKDNVFIIIAMYFAVFFHDFIISIPVFDGELHILAFLRSFIGLFCILYGWKR